MVTAIVKDCTFDAPAPSARSLPPKNRQPTPLPVDSSDLRTLINKLLPKGGLGRAIATLAGGTALGQLATIVATPVLTRLYPREDFGLLGLYTAFLSTLAIIAGLRYEQAVPIAEEDQDAADALGLAAINTVLVSLAVALVLLLWGRPIMRLFEAEDLMPYLWVIPLGLLLQSLNQTISTWGVRRKAFGSLARRKAQQGVFTALTQAALGIAKVGPVGLLLGHGVGQGFGGETLVRNAWKEDKTLFKQVSMAGLKRAWTRYARFPIFSLPAAFLNTLALTMPMLLMARYYGMANNGELQQAMKIMAIPLSLIGAAAGQAFLGEAPKLLRNDPLKAQNLFDRITKKLAMMSMVVILGGISMIWLAPIILGAQWKLAGVFMAFLGFSSALQLVTSPISQITTIIERQDIQLIGDVIRTVLIFAAFAVTHAQGGDATAAVAVYSGTMVATYVAFFILYRSLLRRAVRLRLAGDAVPVDEVPLDQEPPL